MGAGSNMKDHLVFIASDCGSISLADGPHRLHQSCNRSADRYDMDAVVVESRPELSGTITCGARQAQYRLDMKPRVLQRDHDPTLSKGHARSIVASSWTVRCDACSPRCPLTCSDHDCRDVRREAPATMICRCRSITYARRFSL